ncbi:hypothetical protein BDW75DRAFT_228645 [Aspergillus navahoensis]
MYRFRVLHNPVVQDTNLCLDLDDGTEPPQNGDSLIWDGYVDSAYTSDLLSPSRTAEPLHSGENVANHNHTENLDSDAAIFPFDSLPALVTSMNSTIDFSTANYQPSNIYQLSGRSPSLTTAAAFGNIKSGESGSSPSLPRTPVQACRGLPRRKSRYMIQQLDQRANAVFIPPSTGPTDPLERWKESPPEGEAASISAIRDALRNQSVYFRGSEEDTTPDPGVDDLFETHCRPVPRAASTTSGESVTSVSSRRSGRSAFSGLSSGSQTAPSKRPARVQKKHTATGGKKRSTTNSPRIFCCTFCCDKFKSKFDWMRHEKSLHLNLENWVCAPFGGSVVSPSTGRAHCAYCNQLDPTPDHLEQHNHGLCQQQVRTFRRKDHLLQHLRLFHRLQTMPLIDDWKHLITNFPSRCGFCDGRMSDWDERADHLSFHFRKGCTMADWKGDHEFPPEIAAQVTHSVPPYLLDFESRTLVPFSATDGAVSDHLSQMLSRATFLDAAGDPQMLPETPGRLLHPPREAQLDSYTEVLTRHLSHYAQQMMGSGVIPTDEMFQEEARRLLFDSEDQWNQTMADNREWLAHFRGQQSNNGHH